MDKLPINREVLAIKRRHRKQSRERYENQKVVPLDKWVNVSYWVTSLLDAIHEGKKRHQRKRKAAESWWTRNSERLWTIVEGFFKLLIKIF